MKVLSRLHQTRWNAAVKLFQELISAAQIHDARIMFGGTMISPSQIEINPDSIHIRPDPNCAYIMFEADPNMNHGLYETIGAYEKYVREKFTLVKTIPW